jgi:hypothetical protein
LLQAFLYLKRGLPPVVAFKDEPKRICIFSKLNGAFAADLYCIRREEKRGVECFAFEHHLSHAILRLGHF